MSSGNARLPSGRDSANSQLLFQLAPWESVGGHQECKSRARERGGRRGGFWYPPTLRRTAYLRDFFPRPGWERSRPAGGSEEYTQENFRCLASGVAQPPTFHFSSLYVFCFFLSFFFRPTRDAPAVPCSTRPHRPYTGQKFARLPLCTTKGDELNIKLYPKNASGCF